MKPTHAPHIKARRAPRPHQLMADQVRRLKLDGDIWLAQRHGIVVWRNDQLRHDDPRRILITPRDLRLEMIPGFFPPPESFGETWLPIDWIRQPGKLTGDPKVARIMFLRRIFYELKRGRASGQWRAHDIWPQTHKGQGPLWPWEDTAVLPES